MSLDLILRNGLVVRSTGSEVADIGIRDGKIVQIGHFPATEAKQTFDVKGRWVMPGAIDTQVHFREPGLTQKEDLESGTRAALHGGVTSILEMPNTSPTTTDPEALEDKLARAAGRAWCNFGFFVGATAANAVHLADWEKLPGTPGVKIFVGSSTGSLLVDEEADLRQVFAHGVRRCAIHAEDEGRNRTRKQLFGANISVEDHPEIRDAESAIIATKRVIRLAKEFNRPTHILHITTMDEVEIIAEAKADGIPITAEVTPQHLFFAAPDCYRRLGTLCQMNPPIRSKQHQRGLWNGLAAGVFDVFGSDHAPHTLAEKSQPYPASPSGMPGVQTLLPVLLNFVSEGKLSKETLVKMLCETPADLYGIHGKGRLAVGYDADIVIVDPSREVVFTRDMVQSKCGWSPYEGEKIVGWPELVILAGKVAVQDDSRIGSPAGKMLQFD